MQNWKSGMQHKVIWGIRIVTWLVMLVFGIMKVAGWSAAMAQYWVAATDLLPFLDFLSDTTWGWIATAGEIISWLFLLSWCWIMVKYWAILALLIMVFAATQGIMPPWIIVVIWSLVVLTKWWGARKLCGKWCPCNKWCNSGTCDIQ